MTSAKRKNVDTRSLLTSFKIYERKRERKREPIGTQAGTDVYDND